MRIEYLREYVELCNQLNFNSTAESLHISQSALSKHIKALESDIGATLFERDKHHVWLTAEGEMFLSPAKNIVDLYSNAQIFFENERSNSERILIGGIIDSAGLYSWIAGICNELHRSHPNFKPHFIPTENTSPVVQVANGEVDCAIMHYNPHHYNECATEQLAACHLFDAPIMAVVDGHGPLAKKRMLTADDMQNSSIIHMVGARTNSGWDGIRKMLGVNGIKYTSRDVQVYSSFDIGGIKVESSILLLPEHEIDRHMLANPDIAVIPLDIEHATMSTDVVYRPNPSNRMLAKLIEHFRRTPYRRIDIPCHEFANTI